MFLETKKDGEAHTKPDPFQLSSLIAWLEKQPAQRSYAYNGNGECLLALYFTAAGFQNVHMFTDSFWHGPRPCPIWVGQDELVMLGTGVKLPAHFNEIARGREFNWTFGAALDRARAFAE